MAAVRVRPHAGNRSGRGVPETLWAVRVTVAEVSVSLDLGVPSPTGREELKSWVVMRVRRWSVWFVLGLLAALVVAPSSTANAASDPTDPTTVRADGLPTVQINGVVWDQAVIGNTVYAAGSFSSARPAGSAAGSNEVARSNILAYNLTTGALITSFAPSVNGVINAIEASPDGSRLYIGGQFTAVGGTARYRVAALNPSTGAVISSFAPTLDASVQALAVTSDRVYVGGTFSNANQTARTKVAAFTTSGTLVDTFNPTVAGGSAFDVKGLAVSPDGSKLAMGGSFTSVNGSSNPGYGLAIVATADGSLQPTAINNNVRDGGVNAAIMSVTADANGFTGTGYAFNAGDQGNFEGVFRAGWDGSEIWVADCHGDTYDSATDGDVVYAVSHHHYCGNLGTGGVPQSSAHYYADAFTTAATGVNGPDPYKYPWSHTGEPSPSQTAFLPNLTPGTYTSSKQAAWDVTVAGDYVLVGGEFTKVNGVAQQGLVRFATHNIAPNKIGPASYGTALDLTAHPNTAGRTTVSWNSSWDRDDETLTYTLYRNGTAVYTTPRTQPMWDPSRISYTDTGLAPGSAQKYVVKVCDPDNNCANSATISSTAASSPAADSYSSAVLADAPGLYWRLGEGGGTAQDWVGSDSPGYGSGISADTGDSPTASGRNASAFNGSSSAFVASTKQIQGPYTFSQEVWFKTSAAGGGRISGFGDSNTTTSYGQDRSLYVDATGHLTFGVWDAAHSVADLLSSPGTVNDGSWHQAVATLSSQGMSLYLDGKLVASNPSVTKAENYVGYWRVGYDPTWSGNPGLVGDIADYSVYPSALTAAQVNRHWVAAGNASTFGPPTASFTTATSGSTLTTDASASTAPGNSIASYAWNFGDGSTGTGKTASHTYAAAGTYTVKLTVTDSFGATTSTTQQVTVTKPNAAPKASFTASANALMASFDGSASTDSDGTISGYAWDFGDGSTGTGSTASHTYAAPGTYTVKLTVTDNDSATATATRSLTVTGAPSTSDAFALDSFARTSKTSWGTANRGGTWTPWGVSKATVATASSRGTITLTAAGSKAGLSLPSSTGDVLLSATTSFAKTPSGNGTLVSLTGRTTVTSNYQARLMALKGGVAKLQLVKVVGSTETVLATKTVFGTLTAGQSVTMRFAISGGSTPTLKALIWRPSTNGEPAGWAITATDTSNPLNPTAGRVGVWALLSRTATVKPQTVTVDDFAAWKL